MTEPVTPDHVLRIGMGLWASETLLSAVELGVFTELAREPGRAHPRDQPRAWTTAETQAPGTAGRADRRKIDDVRAALDWCFSPEGDASIGVRLTAVDRRSASGNTGQHQRRVGWCRGNRSRRDRSCGLVRRGNPPRQGRDHPQAGRIGCQLRCRDDVPAGAGDGTSARRAILGAAGRDESCTAMAGPGARPGGARTAGAGSCPVHRRPCNGRPADGQNSSGTVRRLILTLKIARVQAM